MTNSDDGSKFPRTFRYPDALVSSRSLQAHRKERGLRTMKRRTIGVVLALVAAAAVPLGLPHGASAASFDAINVKPLPIEQPGTLSPTGTNTVTMCVQPTSARRRR